MKILYFQVYLLIFMLSKLLNFFIFVIVGKGAAMGGAVGKISAFRPQGPQFGPGSAEIWTDLCVKELV